MRIQRLFFCLTVLTSFSWSTAWSFSSMNELRTQYGKAIEDSKAAEELLDLLNQSSSTDPLIVAYRGATEALIAKHAWNPYRKLEYLDKSMKTLSQAIAADPTNPEIRFLRFSIQYYVPAFLGYSKNLDEDKNVIVEHFEGLKQVYSDELVKGVADFLIKSGRCTEDEVSQLRSYT